MGVVGGPETFRVRVIPGWFRHQVLIVEKCWRHDSRHARIQIRRQINWCSMLSDGSRRRNKMLANRHCRRSSSCPGRLIGNDNRLFRIRRIVKLFNGLIWEWWNGRFREDWSGGLQFRLIIRRWLRNFYNASDWISSCGTRSRNVKWKHKHVKYISD